MKQLLISLGLALLLGCAEKKEKIRKEAIEINHFEDTGHISRNHNILIGPMSVDSGYIISVSGLSGQLVAKKKEQTYKSKVKKERFYADLKKYRDITYKGKDVDSKWFEVGPEGYISDGHTWELPIYTDTNIIELHNTQMGYSHMFDTLHIAERNPDTIRFDYLVADTTDWGYDRAAIIDSLGVITPLELEYDRVYPVSLVKGYMVIPLWGKPYYLTPSKKSLPKYLIVIE